MKTVFYAWQSDLPNGTNRTFIEHCLEAAIDAANAKRSPPERLVLDKDTQGVSGMPVITEVIFSKIASCAVFVGDISFITSPESARPIPNPNVLIELGYALASISDRRIIGVFNEAYGDTHDLPFDLRSRRFPLAYHVAGGDEAEQRSREREKLVRRLAEALVSAAEFAPDEPDTGAANPLPAHAARPVSDSTFVMDRSIARTASRDDEGRENEHVFWHSNPSAWLRVIPHVQKAFTRAALWEVVRSNLVGLEAFGGSAQTRAVLNDDGVIAIGFDGREPETIASRVTQVFRTGEMWGMNRLLIEPQRTEPRTFQIPWPGVALAFERSLSHYLKFAEETLALEYPVTVVAGLVNIKDAPLVREAKWAPETPTTARSFESSIIRFWTVRSSVSDSRSVLHPLYEAIFEACGLRYTEEDWVYKWPRTSA